MTNARGTETVRVRSPRDDTEALGVPRWIIVVAAVGALFIVLPIVGMTARVDWADLVALVTSQ